MVMLHRKRVASDAVDIDSETFTAKTEARAPEILVRIEAQAFSCPLPPPEVLKNTTNANLILETYYFQ